MAAGDAQQVRLAPRNAGREHRAAGEQVDVSGKLTGLMNDDQPIMVPGISDFDLAVFHHVQIDIRLAGPEDRLAVGVVAGGAERLDQRDFRTGKPGKGDVFDGSKSSFPDSVGQLGNK